MPIVIVKYGSYMQRRSGDGVHAVWDGTFRDAVEWCKQKNEHPNNVTTNYYPVRVKTERKKK